MNDFVRQIKQNALAQMKNQYQNLQNSTTAVVNAKFNEKRISLDEEGKKLDEALSQFIAEKQAELNAKIEKERQEVNAKIAEKRQEVTDKKAKNEQLAMQEAEDEACAEFFKETAELLKEIEKLEKELA